MPQLLNVSQARSALAHVDGGGPPGERGEQHQQVRRAQARQQAGVRVPGAQPRDTAAGVGRWTQSAIGWMDSAKVVSRGCAAWGAGRGGPAAAGCPARPSR